MSDFNITLFETCELLNRSKKSISRYIRRGLLHPERVKSQQGTLEYRFSKADIEAFKAQEALKAEEARQDRTEWTDQTGQSGQTRQDTLKGENRLNKGENNQTRQDTPEETGQARQDSEVITLLKETTGLLKEQLVKKDKQINSLGNKIDGLIERDRETNILMGQLQSKVLMLERPKTEPINDSETANFGTKVPKLGETGQPEETGKNIADETGQDEKIEEADKTGEMGQDIAEPAKANFWKRLFKDN